MPQENALRALPAPESTGHVPAVPEYVPLHPAYGYSQPEPEEPVVRADQQSAGAEHMGRLIG